MFYVHVALVSIFSVIAALCAVVVYFTQEETRNTEKKTSQTFHEPIDTVCRK